MFKVNNKDTTTTPMALLHQCIRNPSNINARSLVVNNSETQGCQYEFGYKLCAEVSYLQ